MRQSTLTFVGMLALAIAGCGSDTESSAPTGSAPQPAAKVFDKPMVNQLPSTISSVPVLIQPTNGNQRAKQVQKGRQDPFAGLFAQTGLIPTGATTPGSVPQLSSPSVPERRQTVAVGSRSPSPSRAGSNSNRQQSNPNRSNTGSQSGSGQSGSSQSGSSQSGSSQSGSSQSGSNQAIPLPPVAPDSSFLPAAPPPPQEPDLASNVAVSGVIQIGNETQAIVQVPNEGTSRYVRVGQRLSNGQVLVKRIEMNEGSDPIVILEQYGIEVARAVGEKPLNSAQTGTSTDGSQSQPSPDASTDPAQTSTPTDSGTGTPTQTSTPTDSGIGTPTQITTPTDSDAAQPDEDTPVAPLDSDSTQPGDDTTTNTSPVAPSLENAPDSGFE